MKNYFNQYLSFIKSVVIISVISTSFLTAQPTTFQKIFYGLNGEVMPAYIEIIQANDKGYLIGGIDRIAKITENGSLQWMKSFTPNPLHEIFWTVAKHYDGGYLFGGSLILKLDSLGNISWIRDLIHSGANVYVYNIRNTGDGGFILGGCLTSNNEASVLIKIDSTGIVQWSKNYKTLASNEASFSLVVSQDKGYVITMNSESLSPTNLFDMVIIKTDSMGNLSWSKRYSSQLTNISGYDLATTNDSGYIVTGHKDGHRLLLKIDSVGNKVWMKKYVTGIDGQSRSVIVTFDNNIVSTGFSSGVDSLGFYETALLMKTDSSGNYLWSRVYKGYSENFPSYVIQTTDSGFAIVSRTPAPGTGFSSGLIKTDSLGFTSGCVIIEPLVVETILSDDGVNEVIIDSAITITSILSGLTPVSIGSEYTLCSSTSIPDNISITGITIFPNPVTSENFEISYSLEQNKTGQLEILNSTGQTIFTKTLPQWSTYQKLTTPDLSNGIYLMRLKSGNKTAMFKFVKQQL